LALIACSCDKPTEPEWHTVKYRVSGTAQSVDVTYENSDGGTSQEGPIGIQPIAWMYTFSATSGTWVYISAQNQGESGSVIVDIIKDGETFKHSRSEGAYVIATCSGTI